jgi:hypothetical protein
MTERSDAERSTLRKRRGHQMHIWLSPHDYARLKDAAEKNGETVSAIVRRLITEHRRNLSHATPRDVIHFVTRASHLHKK